MYCGGWWQVFYLNGVLLIYMNYYKTFKGKNAITLIELMVTIIIVGILASFVVRGLEKTIDGARQKKYRENLLLIKQAQAIYHQKYGHYYPGAGATADKTLINLELKTSVWDGLDQTTQCFTTAPQEYDCQTKYTKGGNTRWTYQITQDMDMPVCSSGTSPCL